MPVKTFPTCFIKMLKKQENRATEPRKCVMMVGRYDSGSYLHCDKLAMHLFPNTYITVISGAAITTLAAPSLMTALY